MQLPGGAGTCFDYTHEQNLKTPRSSSTKSVLNSKIQK